METTATPFIKGYKFRIYPTDRQKELFSHTFGSCRFIYNTLLAEAKAEHQAYVQLRDTPGITELPRPSVSGFSLTAKIATLKKQPETSWLNNVSSVALQQAAHHLGDAFTRFFRTKKGYPKFKKKHGHQSFSLMKSAFRFIDGNLYIAKSDEPLPVNYSRKLPSDPTSITISRSPSGKYFISFLCNYLPPKTSGTKVTGIDVGLTSLITLSDGSKVTNQHHYRKAQKKLRRLQQSLSRKQKGSSNRRKANILLAAHHEHISSSRMDQLHKLTRILINENQVIGLESLVVKNMVRNSKLSKSIHDASWSTLLNLLAYKARESQHCTIVLANQYYPSSHLCSTTGIHLGRKLDLKERSWNCPHCGQTHDRDVNAAINLAKEATRAVQSAPEFYQGKLVVADANWATIN